MMRYVIRPVASLQELAQVFELAGAQLPQRLTRHDRRLAELARRFPADRTLMLVAEDQGGIVGGALAFRSDPAAAACGVTLRLIGVAPAHRGKGLGRRLVEGVEAAARRLGASEISLGASGGQRGFYQRMDAIARDGRDLMVSSNGGDWRVGWCPPPDPPAGTPHGAAAVCVSGGRVVLVSSDGRRWGLPGGRPEPQERWVDTLRREVAEEACAVVERQAPGLHPRHLCARAAAGVGAGPLHVAGGGASGALGAVVRDRPPPSGAGRRGAADGRDRRAQRGPDLPPDVRGSPTGILALVDQRAGAAQRSSLADLAPRPRSQATSSLAPALSAMSRGCVRPRWRPSSGRPHGPAGTRPSGAARRGRPARTPR